MVTQTHARTPIGEREKNPICDCSVQMPFSNQITEIAPISEIPSNISTMHISVVDTLFNPDSIR